MSPLFKAGYAAIIAFAFLVTAMVTGCEKEVNIPLSTGDPQIVINGYIETGLPPVLALTRSIGYFAKIDLATLENSFVHDAVVTVSDGMRQISLREYSIDTLNTVTGGINRVYFYSIDTAQPGAITFRGQTEHFYTLTVTVDGKTYQSTTKIPNCQPVDSMIAVTPTMPNGQTTNARILNVYYSDPDTPGNCIRYFTQRNSEPLYPGLNSVLDDQIINGAKNALLPIIAGSDRSLGITDSTGYVYAGDTVLLKWCAIDRGVFNFYTTYEYSLGTTGNPFASPINIKTNITGGALGIWAGYGTSFYTLTIPL